MSVLVWGVCLFIVSFLTQLFIWKIKVPKRQTKALLMVFFSIMVFGLTAIHLSSDHLNALVVKSPLDYLHICLVFISLTLAYMITYSAIEVDSPTLVITILIANTGSAGMEKKQFYEAMTNEVLVKPRIEDLLTDKMADCKADRYFLTAKGVLLARLFIFFRSLLKMPKGG